MNNHTPGRLEVDTSFLEKFLKLHQQLQEDLKKQNRSLIQRYMRDYLTGEGYMIDMPLWIKQIIHNLKSPESFKSIFPNVNIKNVFESFYLTDEDVRTLWMEEKEKMKEKRKRERKEREEKKEKEEREKKKKEINDTLQLDDKARRSIVRCKNNDTCKFFRAGSCRYNHGNCPLRLNCANINCGSNHPTTKKKKRCNKNGACPNWRKKDRICRYSHDIKYMKMCKHQNCKYGDNCNNTHPDDAQEKWCIGDFLNYYSDIRTSLPRSMFKLWKELSKKYRRYEELKDTKTSSRSEMIKLKSHDYAFLAYSVSLYKCEIIDLISKYNTINKIKYNYNFPNISETFED